MSAVRRSCAGLPPYLRRERAGHTSADGRRSRGLYAPHSQRKIPGKIARIFYGIAARMMRRVLVDHARRRQAAKRRDGEAHAVPLSDIVEPAPAVDLVDVLSLHNALSDLADLDARQSNIVEMRYFGGLTVEEIADCLEISTATVKREWATARLWLKRRMQAG